MKYIKTFNLINENNNEYYESLSSLRYHNIFNNGSDIIDFTKKEINEINDLCIYDVKYLKYNFELEIKTHLYHFQIHKIEDDYFLIKDSGNHASYLYYRCDQWIGLLKFLEDKNLLKVKSLNESVHEYYTTIDHEQYSNIANHINYHPFTDWEVLELENTYSSNNIKRDDRYNTIGIKDISNNYYFTVNKIDDEYYLVTDILNNMYYKCDQWSGLMKLLSDVKFKEPNKINENNYYEEYRNSY